MEIILLTLLLIVFILQVAYSIVLNRLLGKSLIHYCVCIVIGCLISIVSIYIILTAGDTFSYWWSSLINDAEMTITILIMGSIYCIVLLILMKILLSWYVDKEIDILKKNRVVTYTLLYCGLTVLSVMCFFVLGHAIGM